MQTKRLILGISAAFLAVSLSAQTFDINLKKPGAPIQSTMYGIFFEDINFAADGGLYAELVKNRSFEFTSNYLQGWKAFGKGEVREDGPFERNPHYVRLSSPGHQQVWTGLQNEGFFGIGLQQDAEYRFSVWARVPEGKTQKLRVQLIDENRMQATQELAQEELTVDSKEWKKYTLTIKSPCTINRAQLRLFLCDENGTSGTGVCDVEHVSLFPVDTWKGHENGLRRDLAQALADMHPGVFRFPGGCIVEGVVLDNRYQWKNTVGPVENRPINMNRWQSCFASRFFADYYQTYGLGFYEYFVLSEEIGSEPLPILNVGMACQYQNWENEAAHVPATQKDLQPFIDDCNDLIEFANGDVSTKWGKLRADMGHPAPFNMKFLGIGNEQWGQFYFDRYKIVADGVRKAHPEIKIIAAAAPNLDGEDFKNGWEFMRKEKADLIDEHYYRPTEWLLKNVDRYDSYDRKGPKVFAGEYACHDGGKAWNHAGASIYEAAIMTGFERNADIVQMTAYAPLFAHVDGWQWRPDLIWFDGDWDCTSEQWRAPELLAMVRETNPDVVVNSRIRGNGDYATPELGVPVTKPADPWWETCMTINDSWGFRKIDTEYKSEMTILRMLVNCMSLGGNLLLDIGPRADGTIPEEEVSMLKTVGRWVNKHAEAVYPTRAGIPDGHVQGYTTLNQAGDVLYVYLPYTPNESIEVKGLKTHIKNVRVVGTDRTLDWQLYNDIDWSEVPGVYYINVPEDVLDEHITVLALELEGPLTLYRGSGQVISFNL